MDTRKTYFDAEPWYQREGSGDWYQQCQSSNEAMVKILRPWSKGSSILEIGCGGVGWLGEFLLTEGCRKYHGIDLAESAISRASERLSEFEHVTLTRGDALNPQWYDDSRDLIVANQFLHCIIGADRSVWFDGCHSCLSQTEGRLVLSSMVGIPDHLSNEIDRVSRVNRPGNRYYAEPEEIREELRRHGFSILTEHQAHQHDIILTAQAGP